MTVSKETGRPSTGLLQMTDKSYTKSNIIYKPLPEENPMQRQPDISLTERKLDWLPNVELKQGLKKTIKYFESIADSLK